MAHESQQGSLPTLDPYTGSTPSYLLPDERAQYSSSSSGEEEEQEEEGAGQGGGASVSWMGATGGGGGFDDEVEEIMEDEGSDEDDEGYTVKVRQLLRRVGQSLDGAMSSRLETRLYRWMR